MAEGKPEVVDSELDNLLDSALSEFDAQKEKEKQEAAQQSVEPSAADKAEGDGAFSLNQMRESLQTFMKDNPLLNAQNAGDDSEFAKAMQETLGLFTKSLDRFQERGGEFNTEDFLSDVFKNLNVDGGAPFGDFLAPGLDDVLTKNLLYPGLKDIHDKFPTWLDENQEKLSDEDRERFEAQNAIVKQIVEEYDSEKDDDSKEVKGERQQRILELLAKMQALGDPPIELLGKQPGLDFAGLGEGSEAVPPECAQQ